MNDIHVSLLLYFHCLSPQITLLDQLPCSSPPLIISEQGIEPIIKLLIVLLKILRSSTGGCRNVHSFVYVAVYF